MENQDQEVIDEEVITSNDDEWMEEGEGENEKTTPDKNKNTSNFKALYKAKKELESELASKDDELARTKAELEEWRKLNPEISENFKEKKDLSSMQEELFYVKNPDAENYAKQIQKTIKEYNLPNNKDWYKKAWNLVKSEIPEESKTKTDFNIWKKSIIKKDLKDVTPEEALELPKEKKSEWRKIHWFAGM